MNEIIAVGSAVAAARKGIKEKKKEEKMKSRRSHKKKKKINHCSRFNPDALQLLRFEMLQGAG